MDVTVAQVPSCATVVNLQKIGDLSGVKAGPWKQRCDYMVALDAPDGSEVVFVELKKSLDTGKDKAMEQLRRSPPVAMYLKSLCELDAGRRPKEGGLRFRYVVIGERYSGRLDKRPLRPGRATKPEPFKTIQVGVVAGNRVNFHWLVRAG